MQNAWFESSAKILYYKSMYVHVFKTFKAPITTEADDIFKYFFYFS